LSRAGTTTPFALTAVGYLLTGAGFGLLVPGLTKVGMRDVPPGVSGAASGVLNASKQVGTSVGLAVLGSLGVAFATSNWHTTIQRLPASARAVAAQQAQNVAGAHVGAVTKALGPSYRDAAAQAFVHGYHLAVGIAAACLLAGGVAALLGFRRRSSTTPAAVAVEVHAGPTSQQSSASTPPGPTKVTADNGYFPATQPVRDTHGPDPSAEEPNMPRSRMRNGGRR
jgi:hypothetical protein